MNFPAVEKARGAVLAKLEKAGAKGAASLFSPKTPPAKRAALEEALAALEREEALWVDRRRAKARFYAQAHRPALPTAEGVAARLEEIALAEYPAVATRARWKAALKKERAAVALVEPALVLLLQQGRMLALSYRKARAVEEVFLPTKNLPAPAFAPAAAPLEAEAVWRAYAVLAARTGFPAVPIAALQQESGAELAQLKAWVLAEHQAGRAIIARGDWSLADEARRAAAVPWQGQPYLLVRLLP